MRSGPPPLFKKGEVDPARSAVLGQEGIGLRAQLLFFIDYNAELD